MSNMLLSMKFESRVIVGMIVAVPLWMAGAKAFRAERKGDHELKMHLHQRHIFMQRGNDQAQRLRNAVHADVIAGDAIRQKERSDYFNAQALGR